MDLGNKYSVVSIIIIVIALLGTFLSKPEDKESYHKAIFSIFGIAVFFVWHFLNYFAAIDGWSELSTYIALAAIMIISALICVTPWLNRITLFPALGLVVLFIITMGLRFGMEIKLKNTIAEANGYFNKQSPFSRKETKIESSPYASELWRYTVDLPASWQKQKHESGLTYFVKFVAGKKLAELRPRCYSVSNVPVASADFSRSDRAEQTGVEWNKYCFIAEGQYQCLLKGKPVKADKDFVSRWLWSKTGKWDGYNLSLEFVFYQDDPSTMLEAEYISQSLAALPGSQPLESCITIMEWL